MITLLSKLLIKDYKNTSDLEVRLSYGMLCGGVGVFFNILLFVAKMAAGIISGSIAVTADAFNNLSDAGSSIITLVGFKMAGQKPDKDHPFGHGRIEYISGFLVSVIILIMAFELMQSSVKKIFHPEQISAGPLVFLILTASILVKLYMFFYNRNISKKIDSAAMDAASKDSLSDAAATTVVLLATLTAQLYGIQIDGWCGIIVALFIFFAGYSAAKETISPLLGQPPDPSFVKRTEEIIMEYRDRGALGIHDLVVHNYGPGRIMLSTHVEVPSTGDIMVLHDMIDTIEHRLAKELNCSAVIHMDPICLDDELTNSIREEVASIVGGMEGNIKFHDFRIVSGPARTNLIFDVVVPFDYPMSDNEVVSYIREKARELNENYFVVIDVDKESQ